MAIRLANMDFSRDPRTGRVRIVRSWHVDTEDEIESAPELAVMGYPFTGELNAANWDADDITAGFQVDAVYEGLTASYADGVENGVWSFRPAFEKEPVEKLPNIDYLITNWGGQEDEETGRVIFRRKLGAGTAPATGTTGNGLQPSGRGDQGSERINPLYGLNESGWLSMGGYAAVKFIGSDAAQLGGVGQIVDDLPGSPPDYGIDEDRNWLKAPPIIDEIPQAPETSGGVRLHDIELHFLLSPKGGWPPAVYKFIDV